MSVKSADLLEPGQQGEHSETETVVEWSLLVYGGQYGQQGTQKNILRHAIDCKKIRRVVSCCFIFDVN